MFTYNFYSSNDIVNFNELLCQLEIPEIYCYIVNLDNNGGFAIIPADAELTDYAVYYSKGNISSTIFEQDNIVDAYGNSNNQISIDSINPNLFAGDPEILDLTGLRWYIYATSIEVHKKYFASTCYLDQPLTIYIQKNSNHTITWNNIPVDITGNIVFSDLTLYDPYYDENTVLSENTAQVSDIVMETFKLLKYYNVRFYEPINASSISDTIESLINDIGGTSLEDYIYFLERYGIYATFVGKDIYDTFLALNDEYDVAWAVRKNSCYTVTSILTSTGSCVSEYMAVLSKAKSPHSLSGNFDAVVELPIEVSRNAGFSYIVFKSFGI